MVRDGLRQQKYVRHPVVIPQGEDERRQVIRSRRIQDHHLGNIRLNSGCERLPMAAKTAVAVVCLINRQWSESVGKKIRGTFFTT
jgi:hypothetical protein